MDYLYKNWAFMCLPLAIFCSLILASSAHSSDLLTLLIWLQFPVYLLHQFEEHAKPGGFKHFVNREIFKIKDKDVPLNDANIFWINILAIWFLFPIGAVLAQNYNLSIGAVLPYFGLFNATIHILHLLIFRKYNPGSFVSLFLNYPTGLYTLKLMHEQGLLTSATTCYSLLLAFLGHAAIVVYAVKRYCKSK